MFGGIVGTVLTAGYWTFVLYAKFRNPVFPFFNSVFKSPFHTVYTAASLLTSAAFCRVHSLMQCHIHFNGLWGCIPRQNFRFGTYDSRSCSSPYRFLACLPHLRS